MKKFWKTVSIALICGMLTTPQIDARGRDNNTSGTTQNAQLGKRPTTGSNNSATKPSGNSNNTSKPGNNSNNAPKPGNNSNNAPKPGGNSNNAPKPGGNSNNAPKPGNNSNNAPKPGGNSNNAPKPGGNSNNAPKPGNNSNKAPKPGGHKDSHNSHINRPHCPPTAPYHRPTPPTSFRPSKGSPSFRAIFGIALGSTINISLDYLNRNSYNINGYGNDVIYLRNVTEYGYMWPDATLYYEANRLVGTQLMYSTNYNNHSRYNMVYSTLTNQYGNPINIQYVHNGMIATWWGYDGQYITLEYHPTYTNNGQLRYITTLSFGM